MMVKLMAGRGVVGAPSAQSIVLAFHNPFDEHEMHIGFTLSDAMVPMILARLIKQAQINMAGACGMNRDIGAAITERQA